MFVSVQGEGKYTGTPSIFLRTSGCDLRCNFCDTPYTSWKAEYNPQKVNSVINSIKTMKERNKNVSHLVITGGEPYLQKGLDSLVESLKDDFFITIETNGIKYRYIDGVDLVSWSPKMSNSYPLGENTPEYLIHKKALTGPNNYSWIIKGPTDYQVKFVIDKPQDLEEVLSFVSDYKIQKEHVFLMPQARTKEELLKSKWLVEKCIGEGFNFSNRLQVELYGDKRGV